ncbi:MAG: Rieske (2Fe-2S) protein [Myxococcales bacterium]|nr:Rieske (2Fe-2S) protein [Myxococcales bacterium]
MGGEGQGSSPHRAAIDSLARRFPAPICRLDHLQDGRFAFDVDDDTYLVVQAAGAVHIVDGLCPHQYFPLEFAHIEDETVLVCPLHGWRFDVTTGVSPDTPQIALRRWPAEIRSGAVFVSEPRLFESDSGLTEKP